jgi:hypothetical protein
MAKEKRVKEEPETAPTGVVRMRAGHGIGSSTVGGVVYVAGEDGTAEVSAEHVAELEGHGWSRVE